MFKRRAIFAALLALSPVASLAQMTEVTCVDRARLMATLTDTLGAQRQGTGLRDRETMLEVWVTPVSGDWMIVQHYANGTSCIMAMGAYWESTPPNPA
ncbi:MAG: hypothetical protein AAFQ54_14375 [Pseudomonadota bacterium]